MKIKNKINKSSKKIKVSIAILLIACIAGLFLFYTSKHRSITVTKPTTTLDSSSKSSITKKKDSPTINRSADVPVIIVDASRYNDIFEVRAYASDVVEDGTCTFSFTSSTNTIKKTTAAIAGSNTSSCATLDIPMSELGSNSRWSLTVSYLSNSSSYKGLSSVTINLE